MKSVIEFVVVVIKKVVYVIMDVNLDGEDYIVKMVFFFIVVKLNFVGIKLLILVFYGFWVEKRWMVDKDNFRNIS